MEIKITVSQEIKDGVVSPREFSIYLRSGDYNSGSIYNLTEKEIRAAIPKLVSELEKVLAAPQIPVCQ